MTEAARSEGVARAVTIELYRRGMIRTWYRDKPDGWTLVSGLWSPVYIQLRILSAHPDTLRLVSDGMARLIRERVPDATQLVGVALAGIPLAVATALALDIPCAITRKMEGLRSVAEWDAAIATYGSHALVEGELRSGDRLVVVDDLVTRFDSKIVALRQVEHEVRKQNLTDVRLTDVAVLFDREQGASDAATRHGVRLHSLVPFVSQGLNWLRGALAPIEYDVLKDYFDNYESYQDADRQRQLKGLALQVP